MSQACLVGALELARMIAVSRPVIFDCSFDLGAPDAGRETYLAGHVPGAQYLHLDHDLSSAPSGSNGRHPLPDPVVLAARLRELGLRREDQVVAYDASGGPYAARLWWLLRWMGHAAVAVLDGGRQAWEAAGLPLESGAPPDIEPGDFVATGPDQAMTVDVDEVLAGIGATDRLVIDARAPGRFRGEANPLDPIAGRIPGARNRLFMDNLSEGGVFKPADVLARDFAAVLRDRPPEQVILQCGSGVTACHNALAMAAAGLNGARLYPGSWSEWIADPSRPRDQG